LLVPERGLWVWHLDVMHDCAGVFAFGPSNGFEKALFNAFEGEGWHGSLKFRLLADQ
jgi:hypothetical protein